MASTKTVLNNLYGDEAKYLRLLIELGNNIDASSGDAPFDAAPIGGIWTSETSLIVYTAVTWSALLTQLQVLLASNIIDVTSFNNMVDNNTAENIGGVKTFTDKPVVPNGTAAGEAVNKGQLDTKEDVIIGAASSITSSDLTADKLLGSNGSGKVVVLSPSTTEASYLAGVTSAIQTQLNTKAAIAGQVFTGDVEVPNLQVNGNTYLDSTSDYTYWDSGKIWYHRGGCTDVQLVPMVFGTSSTPPAGTYPVGTIYLEHEV